MISRSSIFVPPEILSESKGRTEDITGSSICIWMVDDNDNFRSLLAELLGYEEDLLCSRQFPSAEAVLEALAQDAPPDIILLDIQMRGQSGLDAVRPIKILARSTIVLMLTTFYDSHAKARALRDGATDLLLKSYSVDEIARHIRQAHEQRGRDPMRSSETESATSTSTDCNDRCTEELNSEQFNNEGAVASCAEKKSRNPSWRNPLARGVNYLRTLLTARRGSRKSNEASSPLGSAHEISCVSE